MQTVNLPYTSADAQSMSLWVASGTPLYTERSRVSYVSPFVADKFRRLVAQWHAERGPTSSISQMAMHPAYQQIIGMGMEVVPLLLGELTRELDHWFWALKAITGVDPVPPASRGKMRDMAEAWFRWGRQQGYLS